MPRRHRATIQELSEAVRCLPRATRISMLEGLDAGPIIAGAYTSDDGVCPMLAAHRAGGRCNAAFFADAWDRFAFRDERGRGRIGGRRTAARRVNARELRILRVHLEASLLDEELGDATLAGALHEHRELLSHQELPARRRLAVDPGPIAEHAGEPASTRGRQARPGDRNRAAELRNRAGWAWSGLFRRYDEYEAALVHLHAAADAGAPSDRRTDGAETVNA